MSPERKIEAHLVKLAERHGWFCRKVKWVGRNGCPDRLLIPKTGGAIWVEIKAPGKRPTRQQAAEHYSLTWFGQDVRVVDSVAGVEALFQ